MRIFHGGQEVWLKANEDEGWQREPATVEGEDGEEITVDDQDLLMVRVEPSDEDPDGLREVEAQDVED